MKKKQKYHNGGQQLPLLTPDSDWVPPTTLPDLRRVSRLAFDTEGNDEGLSNNRGSGWPYKAGYVAGISIAWADGAFYAPIRHPETTCFDHAQVGQWLRDHIKAGCKFITHHGSHDWGWVFAEWGIECPAGQVDDTEAMAMMVDENRLTYRLENLCGWRGVAGKDENKLREAAEIYGFNPKSELWKLPARYVGPYAEQDAKALLPLADSLMKVIQDEKTIDGYQLEMEILPTVLRMRRRGIRIDLDGAHALRKELLKRRDVVLGDLSDKLEHTVGIDDCRSSKKLEQWFNALDIKFPRTEKTGVGSFKASWMRVHPHWLPQLVAKAEQLTEAADKFVDGFILKYAHKGRLHAHINQYRGEEGGTRSYRFSYSDPPLQQMPARDKDLGPAIRGLFLPEEGEIWAACDYSQQEYRLIVHYAALSGSNKAGEAVNQYVENPNTDFHDLVAQWTGLDRKPAKDTNFAKAFGAGVPKFALMIGKSVQEAQKIYDQYDRELPFVSITARQCSDIAMQRGYIKLIDGTRSHFDRWERARYDKNVGWEPPLPRDEAVKRWPGQALRRAFTHKAFNRLIQGSAARMTKIAIRNCAAAGFLPLIQMHDELGFSVTSSRQTDLIKDLMCNAVPLRVPVKVDVECGSTWGKAKGDPAKIDWPRVSSQDAGLPDHTRWYNQIRSRQRAK